MTRLSSVLVLGAMLAGTAFGGERGPQAQPGKSGRSALRAERAAVWRTLYPTWKKGQRLSDQIRQTDDQIAAAELKPVAGAADLRGASVKLIVQDGKQKYIAKPQEEKTLNFERERFALAMRRAGDEPTIPMVGQKVKLPTGRTLPVYVKPFVPSSGSLPISPKLWTKEQKSTILAEHAWAEFLGNYDTKTEQSLLIDHPGGRASLNIDWDQSLSDYRKNKPVTRFKALDIGVIPPIPAAHALLYREYVHGRTDLDFKPTFDAIRRIEKISDAQIREALAPFVARAFAQPGGHVGPYRDGESLIKAVIARRDGLRAKFEAFIGSVATERASNLTTPKWVPTVQRVKAVIPELEMSGMAKFGASGTIKTLFKLGRRLKGER